MAKNRGFNPTISWLEAALSSFSGHFWDVWGAKLGRVSAFRVVSISRAGARCKVARLKASKATGKPRQRQPKPGIFFLWLQKHVRQFCWSLLGSFGREIRS